MRASAPKLLAGSLFRPIPSAPQGLAPPTHTWRSVAQAPRLSDDERPAHRLPRPGARRLRRRCVERGRGGRFVPHAADPDLLRPPSRRRQRHEPGGDPATERRRLLGLSPPRRAGPAGDPVGGTAGNGRGGPRRLGRAPHQRRRLSPGAGGADGRGDPVDPDLPASGARRATRDAPGGPPCARFLRCRRLRRLRPGRGRVLHPRRDLAGRPRPGPRQRRQGAQHPLLHRPVAAPVRALRPSRLDFRPRPSRSATWSAAGWACGSPC